MFKSAVFKKGSFYNMLAREMKKISQKVWYSNTERPIHRRSIYPSDQQYCSNKNTLKAFEQEKITEDLSSSRGRIPTPPKEPKARDELPRGANSAINDAVSFG